MGKRSNFKRVARDCYDTPHSAVQPLLPYLRNNTRFYEPAAGEGALVRHLEGAGHICAGASDIVPRGDNIMLMDFLHLHLSDVTRAEMVITNPPWGRKLLHALILHLRQLGLPAWLLIDANWAFTAQAAPFLPYCACIVTIGRVRWMPGTDSDGKDDCAWFQFEPTPVNRTLFFGKRNPDT